MENNHAPYDVRLVFLALLNMFKHRGNFLNTSLNATNEKFEMAEVWNSFIAEAEEFDMEFPDVDGNVIESILGEKGVSRSTVYEKLCAYMNLNKSQKQEKELMGLVCGKTAKLVNIYGEDVIDEENKKLSICFRDNSDEKLIEAQNVLGEQYYELIMAAKAVHDVESLVSS